MPQHERFTNLTGENLTQKSAFVVVKHTVEEESFISSNHLFLPVTCPPPFPHKLSLLHQEDYVDNNISPQQFKIVAVTTTCKKQNQLINGVVNISLCEYEKVRLMFFLGGGEVISCLPLMVMVLKTQG